MDLNYKGSNLKKILIVDDSKLARDRVKTYLSELAFSEIYEAQNGQEALDIYLEHRPEIITLDIEMPIINGIEVVKELVQISNELKIIWISSVENKQKLLEAQGLCKSVFIKKPISKEQLLNALKIIMR